LISAVSAAEDTDGDNNDNDNDKDVINLTIGVCVSSAWLKRVHVYSDCQEHLAQHF